MLNTSKTFESFIKPVNFSAVGIWEGRGNHYSNYTVFDVLYFINSVLDFY